MTQHGANPKPGDWLPGRWHVERRPGRHRRRPGKPRPGDVLPGGLRVLTADQLAPGVLSLVVADEHELATTRAGRSQRLPGEQSGPRIETTGPPSGRHSPVQPARAAQGAQLPAFSDSA
jgi:hypothetical protein